MGKTEWGRKRICPSCALKYYDFNRSPINCPSCNAEFDSDLYLKSRKGKNLTSKTNIDNNENLSNIEELDNDIESETPEDDNNSEVNKDLEAETDIVIEDDVSFVDEEESNEDGIEISSVEIEDEKN